MSKFKTSLPVDLDAVKKLLPEGAHVHHVEWDEAEGDVNIVWEHEQFTSGLDFPVEFPVINLEIQTPPKGVKMVRPARATKPTSPARRQTPAPAALLTEEEAEQREYQTGFKLAQAHGRIEMCQSDAAKRGFEDALKPETKPEDAATTAESGLKEPVVPPSPLAVETVTTGNAPESPIAAGSPTAVVTTAEAEAPKAAAAPVAAPQGAVPTRTAKRVAKTKRAK